MKKKFMTQTIIKINLNYPLILLLTLIILISGCSTYTPSSVTKMDLANKRVSLNTETQFIWGVNGHPITNIDYVNTNLDQDIKLLKEHQFRAYRFDIRLNEEGKVLQHAARFQELLQKASKENISIHPVILINLFLSDYKISQEEAYRRGYTQMKGFAKKYAEYLHYYTLGNEQDLRLINKGSDGVNISDYDREKFRILASYLKGMYKGLKENDPSALAIINSAGWLHLGYYELLAQEKVPYDILGYNWYSKNITYLSNFGQGDILKQLHDRFQKPIWLTEINAKRGSYDSETEQASMMKEYIESLHKQKYINAFFVYELYDQPGLIGQNWAGEKEAYYGIVRWEEEPNQYSKYSYKPVSNVIKFGIEEADHGYEDYIIALYHDLLNKKPTEKELMSWILKLEKTTEHNHFLNQFYTEHNLIKKVSKPSIKSINTNYQKLLGRSLTEEEVKFWERNLKIDKEINIIKTIISSKEYWERAIWDGYHRRTGYKYRQLN
ncbi:MAG: glycosyl hydrolase [Weeksellaceae bacterium]